MIMHIAEQMIPPKLPGRRHSTKTLEHDQNSFHSQFTVQQDFHGRSQDQAEEFSQPEETAKPDIEIVPETHFNSMYLKSMARIGAGVRKQELKTILHEK